MVALSTLLGQGGEVKGGERGGEGLEKNDRCAFKSIVNYSARRGPMSLWKRYVSRLRSADLGAGYGANRNKNSSCLRCACIKRKCNVFFFFLEWRDLYWFVRINLRVKFRVHFLQKSCLYYLFHESNWKESKSDQIWNHFIDFKIFNVI